MNEQAENDLKETVQPEGQGENLDQEAIKIIARTTGQEIPAEEKAQSAPDQDSSSQEDKQPEATLEIFEDEVSKLNELGYTEEDYKSGELTREDIDNILATGTKKESVPAEQSEILITSEMAAQYGGIAKNFIGKPIGELFKAIQEGNSHIGKLSAELKKHEALLTENEKIKVDKLEEELFNDPNLNEEQFKAKHKELVKMQAEILARSMAPDPEAGKKEAEFYEVAQAHMPEGIKFQEVSEEWWKQVPEVAQKGYLELQSKQPALAMQIMLDAIKTFAQLKVKDSTIQTKEKELTDSQKDKQRKIAIAAAKKASEAIRNSNGQHVQGSRVNIVPRKVEKTSSGDPVTDAILARHTNE